jgi:hypothetical protein
MSRWCSGLLVTVELSIACLAAACAPRMAPPPVLVAADPTEVFAVVRQRENTIHSMRARFSATVYQGENVRRAEGVLLVKKPERFRLRLLSPFGFTVFDYVTYGTHASMELPLEGKRLIDGEIAAQSAFSPVDLRQAFLRGEAAFPGRCTPRGTENEVTVDCRSESGEALREISIAGATATVTREISFAGEQPSVVTTFSDYRMVDAMPLPFTIELSAPQRHVTMQIVLRSYEINPALADALFDPAAGATS